MNNLISVFMGYAIDLPPCDASWPTYIHAAKKVERGNRRVAHRGKRDRHNGRENGKVSTV